MLTPHIQILNERFISRYGVDRILLLMARHFTAMGARVSFGCLRYNEELFDKGTAVVKLPAFEGDIFANIDKFMNAEKAATDGMMAEWLTDKPDLILIGGWPFFDLAARAGSVGVRTVFIDAGAVPHTGYGDSSQAIQQELRRIRAQTLPFIDKVLPISDFIRFSQTEPDRCTPEGVRTIHLGADHLREAQPPKTESKKASSLQAPIFENTTTGKQSAREDYRRRLDLLNEFGMFDSIWYRKRYQDRIPAGQDPKAHFLNVGSYELLDPGPSFSAAAYLQLHPDVAKAGMEPWFHYVVHGYAEERATSPVAAAERRYPKFYPLLERLKALKQAGRKLVLLGGRFEAGGYKNSMSAVHVTRGIRDTITKVTLLVLEQYDHLPLSDDIKKNVEGIGSPSDYELLEIIRLVDLTLSTSLWEGFNLPLVESQYEGCPVLAYACGSHPEVIADPWFLCQNEAEMAQKAVTVLKGNMPPIARTNLENYSHRFPWTKTLAEIWEEVDDLLRAHSVPEPRASRRLLFLDVGAIAFNVAHADALQAVRALCANLLYDPALEVVFTSWDEVQQCFTLVAGDDAAGLHSPLSALPDTWVRRVGIDKLLMAAAQRCVLPPVLLFPVAPLSEALAPRMAWARSKGLTCAAVLHDPASANRRAYVSGNAYGKAPDYYSHLLTVDALICKSSAALEMVLAHAEEKGLSAPPFSASVEVSPPFGGQERVRDDPEPPGDEVRILGVGAKGSAEGAERLVNAVDQLRRRLPHRRITLTLVGFDDCDLNRDFDGGALPHLGTVSRAQLQDFLGAAHFAVCPSLQGGIDLFAAESRWMARPCLFHSEGRGDGAYDGGCLAVDMRSERVMGNAMADLIEEPMLYRRLAREAVSVPLSDWASFVDGVAEKLREL